MADARRQAAKVFAEYWKGKGYEKGESQAFWLSLLRDVSLHILKHLNLCKGRRFVESLITSSSDNIEEDMDTLEKKNCAA